MENLIIAATGLIRALQRASTKKWSFFALFLLVFLGSTFVLGRFDLLPDTTAAVATSAAVTASTTPIALTAVATSTSAAIVESPIKIEIPAIKLAATIANPTRTDSATLDQNLLKGAVRYPTSAKLAETGNVVLFGHSSYLPVVRNQAYKTFNGIQKLVAGNVITVYSSGMAYTYSVKSVAKESASDNSAIPLEIAGKMLTLVTCNSFGTKEDRFVVTADFVESHSIST
jgi:LPXTG-site transpeptidase (sortase) family protein